MKGVDYLVNLFVKNSNYLRSLVYRTKREKELKLVISSIFILLIGFNGLYWIYLTCFCYCYKGEQVELFIAFLATQFYMEIYCIIFELCLAV